MKYNPAICIAAFMECGIPKPELEYKFHPQRRWMFDFAFPDHKVALEVEGAIWTQGRHTRGSGFLKDMEKYNAAACLGWRVIRCTPQTLLSLETIGTIKQCLKIS